MSTAVEEPQAVEGTASGEDPEAGKLFEVPPVSIVRSAAATSASFSFRRRSVPFVS